MSLYSTLCKDVFCITNEHS